MTINQHMGVDGAMNRPSGRHSVGSHSQITHGGGSVGGDGVSVHSLSHSVRFNDDDENKKGSFLLTVVSPPPALHIHALMHISSHQIHHSLALGNL